ncbi:MAG TPA: cbb3-type cytochrome c oxidase N-terminal domain-containing protein [Bacteroidota bacterium]|nr:cbb3-type cytochrome c oxidase N-terminal domain-containing protein [Bacteroidota bacterium]
MNIDHHLKNSLVRLSGAGISLLLTSATANAQTAETATNPALMFTGLLTLLFILLVLFVIFVLDGDVEPITRLLKTAYNSIAPKQTGEVQPLEENHDGITELDNLIPPWFNYLFGGTIVFAVFYMLNYHVWQSSPLPQAEYAEELAAADLSRRVRMASEGTINEDALVALVDDASIKAGQEKFLRNCITCHGTHAEGIVGPNLTDQYWIHGGGIKNVYTTIKNGVPEKGMISWKLVFTPKEIQQIASYVLSLQGSNPPNAKKPEGNLYVEPKPQPKDSTNAAKAL